MKISFGKYIRIFIIVLATFMLSGCYAFTPEQAGGSLAEKKEPFAASAEKPSAAPSDEEAVPTLSLTRSPRKGSEESVKDDGEGKDGKKKKKKGTGEAAGPDTETPEKKQELITEDGIYHDLESVVLYYDKFGKLPSNFITKKEARDLGWEGGELDPYRKGASIGGDHFGNFEKRLPEGAKYIECDIDTNGGRRGAKRLIISNDGRYYYTGDHYESFSEVFVKDGKVELDK